MKEKISISFFCYEQHKPFTVTFSRLGTEGKLKIEAIIRTEVSTGTAMQTESVDINKAPISDLDFDAFFCPYCANRSFVQCGVCPAMACLDKDWDSSKPVALPCGHGGMLTESIKEIDSQKETIKTQALTGSSKGAKTASGGAHAWKG